MSPRPSHHERAGDTTPRYQRRVRAIEAARLAPADGVRRRRLRRPHGCRGRLARLAAVGRSGAPARDRRAWPANAQTTLAGSHRATPPAARKGRFGMRRCHSRRGPAPMERPSPRCGHRAAEADRRTRRTAGSVGSSPDLTSRSVPRLIREEVQTSHTIFTFEGRFFVLSLSFFVLLKEAPHGVLKGSRSSWPSPSHPARPDPPCRRWRARWGAAGVAVCRGADRRDPRLDLLRGFCVFAMIVDHVGGSSWLYALTGGNGAR